MRIGIDIDGVITDIPEIIKDIINNPKHEIHIITYREDKQDTIQYLQSLQIQYHHLHMTNTNIDMIQWKTQIIKQHNIELMIEDTPEILAALPNNIKKLWVCDTEIYDLHKAIKGMKIQ